MTTDRSHEHVPSWMYEFTQGFEAYRHFIEHDLETAVERLCNLLRIADDTPGREERVHRSIASSSHLLLSPYKQNVIKFVHEGVTALLNERDDPWTVKKVLCEARRHEETLATQETIVITVVAIAHETSGKSSHHKKL